MSLAFCWANFGEALGVVASSTMEAVFQATDASGASFLGDPWSMVAWVFSYIDVDTLSLLWTSRLRR